MRAAALLLLVCGCALGATREWVNPLGGALTDGANWTGSSPPGPGDIAVFDLGSGSYGVTGSSSMASQKLIVGDDRVSLDLGGAQWDLLSTGGSVFDHALSIGDLPGLSGGLTLTNGSIVADHAYVGLSILTSSSLELIGGAASASVESQMFVGFAGNGEIGVHDGAMLHAGRLVGAAQAASGVGIEVTGAGSTLLVDADLALGRQGPATLRIADGGLVMGGDIDAAARPGSTATIELEGGGSALTATGQLTVGGERFGGTGGNASLEIGESCIVNCAGAAVGAGLPSVSIVRVTGAGALLRAEGSVVLGPLFNAVGSPGGSGSLELIDGGRVEAALVHVGPTGALRGQGEIVGDVETVGLIEPGDGVGELTIDGDLTSLAALDRDRQSVMRFEVGGATPGLGHDRLVVTGVARVGSKLEAVLVEGFEPRVGEVFEIILAGSVQGGFTRFELPQQPPLWRFRTLELQDRIVLEVVEGALPGDANGDGSVDFTDLNLVLSQFGLSGPNLEGDVNFNGSVDFTDLNFVLTSFGS